MDWEVSGKLLGRYLEELRGIGSEASRADWFRDFVRRVFPDVEVGGIKGFYPELEKHLKAVGIGQVVRGKADALFGSLVLEFEPMLDEVHEEKLRGNSRSMLWPYGPLRLIWVSLGVS